MMNRRIFLVRATLLPMALAVGWLGGCSAPDKPTISLYLTIQRGDIDQLRRHLYWGTPVDDPLPNGRYPLHEAAAQGRVVMMRMLLEHGVQLDPRDRDGHTPLELAILNGRTQAADVLIKAGARFDPSDMLLEVARQDITDRDVVRYLKAKGADLDVRDENGNTPLLIAAGHGNHRLVHHLIEFGADINAHNKTGDTALQIVRRMGLPELERFLRNNGAIE
ncbi:MAG: ankyrin repeat domain-containing protein [Gammaproteobacteria bacterium]|nr:MAG: ankyrin repeat domain-containing protein [Gammaproteobacteria bacterium]